MSRDTKYHFGTDIRIVLSIFRRYSDIFQLHFANYGKILASTSGKNKGCCPSKWSGSQRELDWTMSVLLSLGCPSIRPKWPTIWQPTILLNGKIFRKLEILSAPPPRTFWDKLWNLLTVCDSVALMYVNTGPYIIMTAIRRSARGSAGLKLKNFLQIALVIACYGRLNQWSNTEGGVPGTTSLPPHLSRSLYIIMRPSLPSLISGVLLARQIWSIKVKNAPLGALENEKFSPYIKSL